MVLSDLSVHSNTTAGTFANNFHQCKRSILDSHLIVLTSNDLNMVNFRDYGVFGLSHDLALGLDQYRVSMDIFLCD